MRSRLVQAAAFLLVSFGLFIAVAAFLYHYNNKYENTMVYPMGGVVFLDEGTLNQDKPLFLAHQWNCYPDKQYTPEDFEKGSVENGSYITLGAYANFSYGDPERETQGSCTYRLTLSLPETPATYTLYMPEVFSAYTLYLNDTKALTLGNPDPENYRDEVGNQTISFTASGTLHITMIVTNYSHVYSGMVYPPCVWEDAGDRKIPVYQAFDDRGLPYHHGTSGCVFSILRMAAEADICLWICGCVRCVLSCLLLSGVFLIRNLAGTALVCAGSSVPYGGVSSDRKASGKNCETSSKTDPGGNSDLVRGNGACRCVFYVWCGKCQIWTDLCPSFILI